MNGKEFFKPLEKTGGKGHIFRWYNLLTYFHSLPNDKILDWSKMKEFADNNFKFDKNGKEFFKRLEKTVGKGHIFRWYNL